MTTTRLRDRLRITIDTREQTPWHFPEELVEVSRGKLDAGDYAVTGDYGFAIERKSLTDFVGTVASGWKRFLRELDRMDGWPAKVVVVEANLRQITDGDYGHPMVQPPFVFKRIAELTLMGVVVMFAGGPVEAAGLCYRVLMERSNAPLQVLERSDNNLQAEVRNA